MRWIEAAHRWDSTVDLNEETQSGVGLGVAAPLRMSTNPVLAWMLLSHYETATCPLFRPLDGGTFGFIPKSSQEGTGSWVGPNTQQ